MNFLDKYVPCVKWLMILVLVGLMVVFSACNTVEPFTVPATEAAPTSTPVTEVAPTSTPVTEAAPTATALPTLPPLSPEEAVSALGAQVLTALKAQDLATVAALAHPTQGVRFSPYAFVRDEDLVFTPAQLQGLFADPTLYEWGVYDGSGEPIQLTFAAYYQKFVFDHDYTTAVAVSVNERLGMGNSIDNSQEYYPGAMVVEYHFPGFDPQYGGLDWTSLRLVFQEFEGRWVLVGIIHDQWTI